LDFHHKTPLANGMNHAKIRYLSLFKEFLLCDISVHF